MVVTHHRMDKRKSFVFARQYRNCFSRRINALVPRNQPIKTAIGMVTHDFYGLNTMTFHRVEDIADESENFVWVDKNYFILIINSFNLIKYSQQAFYNKVLSCLQKRPT